MKLKSDFIIEMLDHFVDDDGCLLYLVLVFAEGGDLHKKIEQ